MSGGLVISGLVKKYGEDRDGLVFDNLDLSIGAGELVSIFGPNGVGKTTLLNLIAGLAERQSGEIKVDGLVTQSKIGFVFQNYRESLLPWLSARDNITFPLRTSGYQKRKMDGLVSGVKKLVNANFDLNKYPYQLSGGQAQLVCLMRNLVIKPDLFLLDEPFSSLDFQTAISLLKVFMQVWMKTKVTTLFVSHDIDSAIFLSQKIVLLKGLPAKIVRILENNSSYPRSLKYLSSKKAVGLKKKIISIYGRGVKVD